MAEMRTAFFSSDDISLDALEFLLASEEFRLACVVSNPDRPKGRGKKLSPNAVSAWALERGVELLRPEGGVGDATVARMRDIGVEAVIVMAYGSMLKNNVLEYGKYPCLNIHGSLLPKYRGASPVETAIALGDGETGLSLMRVVKKMDSGPVCDSIKIPIEKDDTVESLREKMRKASPLILERNLPSIKNGSAKFVEQDESLATYTRKLDKSDAAVDFSAGGKTICNRIRAFGFGILNWGTDALKVKDASFSACCGASRRAGTILDASPRGLRVACADGSVSFMSLQRPCARMMCAGDFFAGYKMEAGEVLKFSPYKSLLK